MDQDASSRYDPTHLETAKALSFQVFKSPAAELGGGHVVIYLAGWGLISDPRDFDVRADFKEWLGRYMESMLDLGAREEAAELAGALEDFTRIWDRVSSWLKHRGALSFTGRQWRLTPDGYKLLRAAFAWTNRPEAQAKLQAELTEAEGTAKAQEGVQQGAGQGDRSAPLTREEVKIQQYVAHYGSWEGSAAGTLETLEPYQDTAPEPVEVETEAAPRPRRRLVLGNAHVFMLLAIAAGMGGFDAPPRPSPRPRGGGRTTSRSMATRRPRGRCTWTPRRPTSCSLPGPPTPCRPCSSPARGRP